MKIEERIQEMQGKLIKKLAEMYLLSKEEAIKVLEEIGLDNDSATKLLVTFRAAENAKNEAKNVWDSALGSKVGNDNDIAKYQQQEFETRQHFDEVNDRCALIMVARSIEPRAIDDEILGKLYEQGIQENQIANPALRISFHYYCESKAKDNEMQKLKDFLTRAGKQIVSLRNRMVEQEKQYLSLKNSHENLQNEYTERVIADEKHYQAALVQISILKNKLKRLQDRGIFQIIKTKLFGNKIKELPETTYTLPETLGKNASEKMGIKQHVEDLDLSTDKDNSQNKITQEEFQH